MSQANLSGELAFGGLRCPGWDRLRSENVHTYSADMSAHRPTRFVPYSALMSCCSPFLATLHTAGQLHFPIFDDRPLVFTNIPFPDKLRRPETTHHSFINRFHTSTLYPILALCSLVSLVVLH